MLTMFTTCKPFKGESRIVQRNALKSWRRLKHKPDIIIFGDGYRVAEYAARYHLRHEPDVECNDDNYPYVSAMFARAEALSESDVLAYANADLIFHRLTKTVKSIRKQLKHFLLVGHRRDVAVGKLSFNDGWLHELEAQSTLGPPCAVDYFVFTKGLWPRIPPFVVGHVAFDNWLVEDALARKEQVIDVTDAVTAFHQSHAPRKTNRPGDKHNLKLFGGDPTVPRGFITFAPWKFDGKSLRRR